MKKVIVLIFTLCFIFNLSAYASERGTTIEDGIYSSILSEQRGLLIHLPNAYHLNKSQTYPVLYLTDGLRNFKHAAGTLDLLTQSDHAKEMIIVAIKNTHRTRDFTPTYDESYNQWGVSGGADNFLDFIEKELIPHINKRYRSNGFKVLSGHSLGGLLSIYALQTRPQLFQAHFAFSPSLWWHKGKVLKQAHTFYKQKKNLNNYLYLNLADETGHMLSSFEQYRELLGNQTRLGFDYDLEFIKNENHSTSAMVGQNRAYVELFEQFKCSPDFAALGLTGIDACYAQLSTQYGVNLKPDYLAYRYAAEKAITDKRYAEAIDIYTQLISTYPTRTDAYFRLAYLYEGKGDNTLAIKTLDKALKISLKENVENNKIKTFRAHIMAKLPEQTCETAKVYVENGKTKCAL